MEINKKTLRGVFFGAVGCIVLYWLLHETQRFTAVVSTTWAIISPFVVGAVLAFILNVPMRAIEKGLKFVKKSGIRRALALLLTLLAVILVLVGVVYLLVPQLDATVESLVEKLPGFFARVRDRAVLFFDDHPELLEWLLENTDFDAINWSSVLQNVAAWLSNGFTTILERALSIVMVLSSGVFNGIMGFVFCLYCLSRKEILARQARRILYSFLPEKFCDETIRIFRMTNATFSNFLSGQCLEAVILGCMFAVAMSIFRMPFMPLVSVIIAVTALVPIVGAFVGCILGAFFIMVQSPMQAVWFVVMFLVLQQIEGNLVYPRVVGTSIGLPGMWVLVAVAVGGDLMGVGGMLLMIPLAAVIYALLREITDKRLAERKIDREKLQAHPPELKSKFKEKREKKKEMRLLQQMQKLAEKTKTDLQKKDGEDE